MAKAAGRLAAACLLGVTLLMGQHTVVRTYPEDTSAFANAMTGYAPAVDSAGVTGTTLRYLELTWREVEPEEGQYAWADIEKKYDLAALRAQGIHLVLRFVCDVPGKEQHLDIPDWLYEQTGDGSWYHTSYGQGYSPDYANPVLRAAHRRVIAALAEQFDPDGFAAYVELGSLGHWGEWHIKTGEGLMPMPDEAIRDQYAADYLDAFSHAKLLMRRPFAIAAEHRLGLYNDMTGHEKDTREWLGWIGNGGWYGSEPNALTAMPTFWQDAPVGGELTSSLSMQEMLQTELSRTLRLIRASHMSFLGPKTPQAEYRQGYDAILKSLGYRLRITELRLAPVGRKTAVTLTLANEGAAPFYWDWPVELYLESPAGETLQTIPLPFALPELLPGQRQTVTVRLEGYRPGRTRLTLGIPDPMTGRAAVHFAMQADTCAGRVILLS